MRTARISQLWNERLWRRKKAAKTTVEAPPRLETTTTTTTDSQTLEYHDDRPPSLRQPQQQDQQVQTKTDNAITAAIERNTRRLSRIWKNDETSSAAPSRSNSVRQIRTRRSFFRSNNDDQVVLQQANNDQSQHEPLPPFGERETLLKKIRRRSQSLTLPRPSTSSGVSRRHSLFGSRKSSRDELVPAVPALPDINGLSRPRHVPISIDYLKNGDGLSQEAFGMAITSNDVQTQNNTSVVDKPRSRPISSSSSFSQLRVRPTTMRTALQQQQSTTSTPLVRRRESESSEDDVLTALPSMDFKEFHIAELRAPASYYTLPPPPERHVMQRVVPKVVDIVAPRPLTMISAQPPRSSAPPSRDRERHKSMIAPVTTPIGALEDGPKGDWSRTRHSWVGLGTDGDFEQLEWDKLKQFMEAYGSGQDGGIISVRAVGTDSDSSGSARNSNGAKFSNAQALAALEFGL